jgi:hypothetical protein
VTAATDAVDHLLLGAADLDRGIAWLERMTGVRAVIGGRHPGVGTHNALLSLGGRQYLEIIAPDPAQTTYSFPTDLRTLPESGLIAWAVGTTDINAVAKQAYEAGFRISGPSEGSRERLDGKVLKWKIVRVLDKLGQEGVEPVPFFIEWALDSVHPSQDSPQGCELQSFEIEHPDPPSVMGVLKRLGIETRVRQSRGVRLNATLRTPKGNVDLP